MMRLPTLLAAILILTTIILVDASCTTNANCFSCVADKASNGGGCGWCEGSGSCEFGTESGPLSGKCTNWTWESSTCPGHPPTPVPTNVPPTPVPTAPYRPPMHGVPAWNGLGGDAYNSFYRAEWTNPGFVVQPTVVFTHKIESAHNGHYGFYRLGAGAGLLFYSNVKCSYNAAAQNGQLLVYLKAANETTGEVVAEIHVTGRDYNSASSECSGGWIYTGPDLHAPQVFQEDTDTEGGCGFLLFTTTNRVYKYRYPCKTNNWQFEEVWKSDYFKQTMPMGLNYMPKRQQINVLQQRYIWTTYNSTTGEQMWNRTISPIEHGSVPSSGLVQIDDSTLIMAANGLPCYMAGLLSNFRAVGWVDKLTPDNSGNNIGYQTMTAVPSKRMFFVLRRFRVESPFSYKDVHQLAAFRLPKSGGEPSLLYTINTSTNLAWGGNIATDGERFWLPGNLSQIYDYGKEPSPITERLVEDGSIAPYAPDFEDSIGCGAINLIASPQYLFAICSAEPNGNVGIWERFTGKRVDDGQVSKQIDFTPRTMQLRGGWLYLSDGKQFSGVQVLGADPAPAPTPVPTTNVPTPVPTPSPPTEAPWTPYPPTPKPPTTTASPQTPHPTTSAPWTPYPVSPSSSSAPETPIPYSNSGHDKKKKKSTNKTGIIAGSVAAGAVVFAIIMVFVAVRVRRSRRQQQQQEQVAVGTVVNSTTTDDSQSLMSRPSESV